MVTAKDVTHITQVLLRAQKRHKIKEREKSSNSPHFSIASQKPVGFTGRSPEIRKQEGEGADPAGLPALPVRWLQHFAHTACGSSSHGL